MKVTYNSKADTLRILFRNAPIHESEAPRPGLIIDYDQEGGIIGLELASASKHMSGLDPTYCIEYAAVVAAKERQEG